MMVRPVIVLVAALLYVLYVIGSEPAQQPTAAQGWETDLLAAIGNTHPSAETVAYLQGWHRAEGGTAAYNWLNTTQDAPGATLYNCLNADCTIGVKNYPDYQAGIDAIAATLLNGRYPNTLAGLQSNAPVVDDSEMALWGTGGGAVRDQLSQAPVPVGALASSPIGLDGDCGENVVLAMQANGGALEHVTIAPGETFSFNATLGDPEAAGYRMCAGVPGGNWCNLAARYAQVGRALGMQLEFLHHGVDLGAGIENDVLIWNIAGQAGFADGRQDLLMTNTTNRSVTLIAFEQGGALVVTGASS
jgi:hypothetical protein